MLFAGSDDGVYRLSNALDSTDTTAERVLSSDRVRRLETVDALDGIFAATQSGLYHSTDLESWTDLGVPQELVYAVGASPDGETLYAGTRPAHVYAADLSGQDLADGDLAWEEFEGFQDLPSRDEWKLPRHENIAQVRDVHVHPERPDRLVVGVEVGGVHVSEDSGQTWTERRDQGEDGLHDDIHELHLVGPEEFVASTGFGLFRSTDSGRNWTRLDDGLEQRYFRSAIDLDGTIFAGGALQHSATWDDPDADPALVRSRDGQSLEVVDHPRGDETVTGMAVVDNTLLAGTHRGTLLRREGADDWTVAGSFPVPGEVGGRYTPLAWR